MKKTTLRRGTAVALAGLAVLPAYSMVASAASYSTNIYEFKYGTVSEVKSTAKADRLLANNSYVTDYDFDGVFTVSNLDQFDLTDSVVTSWCVNGSGNWVYMDEWTNEEIKVEDYVSNRGGSLGLSFVFKTKAERDAAIASIKAGVKSDYTAKANKAYSQLSKDLTQANNALYKKDTDLADESYKSMIELANAEYENSDKGSDAKERLSEKKKEASTYKTEAYKAASEAKAARSKQATAALAEFKEVYAIGNFDFDHNDDLFVIDDTATIVSYETYGNKISKATYDGTSGNALVDLLSCYYHTTGERVDSQNYAFKGEIIPATDRKKDLYDEYVMSDKWVLFSVFVEGGTTDNNYTTESGSSSSSSSSSSSTTTTTDVKYSTPASSYRTPSNTVYRSSATGMYYPNLAALRSVEGSDVSYTTRTPSTYYSSTYCYFDPVDGTYRASNTGSYTYKVTSNDTTTADYSDPYYYWYINQGYTTTTSSDSSSATMGKKSGWTAIAKSLSSTKSGTVTVKINDEDTIPSSVMSAIKGKDVTVNFVLDNGVTYKVNGEDVTTAKSVNIDTTYNTKNVSKSLVKAAVKKNDGVSSAQLSIDASSLGFTSDVTIKLSSKRAGYSAKLYRYNSSKNSLVLVDSATIKSNGKCTFENVTKGGDFVVVVY